VKNGNIFLRNFRRRELRQAMSWPSESAIDGVLRRFQHNWDRTAVGRHIHLSFERWSRGGKPAKYGEGSVGLHYIWPGDRTAKQMRQYLKERKRSADRERKREDRMNRRTTKQIKQILPRARMLAAALASVLDGKWTESRDIVGRLRHKWLSPGGKTLNNNAVYKALHIAARELCDAGIAEQKIEHGTRSLRWNPASTFRREDFQNPDKRTRFRAHYPVTITKSASARQRSAAKPGTSDAGLLGKNERPLVLLRSNERTPGKRTPSEPLLAKGKDTTKAGGDAQLSPDVADGAGHLRREHEGSSLVEGVPPPTRGQNFSEAKTADDLLVADEKPTSEKPANEKPAPANEVEQLAAVLRSMFIAQAAHPLDGSVWRSLVRSYPRATLLAAANAAGGFRHRPETSALLRAMFKQRGELPDPEIELAVATICGPRRLNGSGAAIH
jgi:hypothetical protein